MTVSSVDHNNRFVAIERRFFQVAVVKVCLFEGITAILVFQWVMNTTLENAMLVVVAESAKTGGNQALARCTFDPKLASQALRVNNVQLVAAYAPNL